MNRAAALPGIVAVVLAVCAARAEAPPQINLRRTVTVQVVQAVKDAVVNISTTRVISRRVSPFGFDMFFDMGDVVRVPANSLGSGFIIHGEGYVVTNNHVVDRARQVTVELADGRKLPAELVSADAEHDLAVLKISSPKPLPTVPLGDSSDLLIGEPVIAVGNPMGFSHSVSTGIVSALHRDLKGPRDQVLLTDLIQTDAAINPGNSGGPLLNAYGQVIGINTAIRGDAQNIGFAIPVNKLRELVPELMGPAQVTKVDVGCALVERREISPPANVSCRVYLRDRGGRDMAVAAINDRAPRDIVDAYAMLLHLKADQDLRLTLADGRLVALRTRPMPQPDALVQAKRRLGIVVEALTPMLAQKYGLAADDGLLISQVMRDSVAAKAGLEAGDVIVSLGRFRIARLEDLGTLLGQIPAGSKVRVGVLRGNQMGYGVLEF